MCFVAGVGPDGALGGGGVGGADTAETGSDGGGGGGGAGDGGRTGAGDSDLGATAGRASVNEDGAGEAEAENDGVPVAVSVAEGAWIERHAFGPVGTAFADDAGPAGGARPDEDEVEVEVETGPILLNPLPGAEGGGPDDRLSVAAGLEAEPALVDSIEGPNRLRGPVGIAESRIAEAGKRSRDSEGPS